MTSRREFIGAAVGAIGYLRMYQASPVKVDEPTLVRGGVVKSGCLYDISLSFSDGSEMNVSTRRLSLGDVSVGMTKSAVWSIAMRWIT